MKRFGKLITLVLVVAMALSLMSVAALAASSSDYKDVVAGKWYVQYVDWALKNEFMTGISDTEWAPNTATTRGMVIQTLYKMAGAPEVEGDSPFADVAEGKYYTDAVKWAAKVGVASGKSTDAFKPEDVLTRQEAVTFFKAFAEKVWELDVSDVSNMNRFEDTADVAKYAKDSMGWAVKAKVIDGSKEHDKLYLMPERDITRAELATMLKALNKLSPPVVTDTPAPVGEGSLVVKVESFDGIVDGMIIKVSAEGFEAVTAKTDADGIAKFEKLPAGEYTVEEVEVARRYAAPEAATVKVEANKEATVTLANVAPEGVVTVTVKAVDGKVKGVEFRLVGTSANGTKVDKTAKTNDKGVATFTDVPESDPKHDYMLYDVTWDKGGTKYAYPYPDYNYINDNGQYHSNPSAFLLQVKTGEATDVTVNHVYNDQKAYVILTGDNGRVGLKGVKFRITGTDANGVNVDETAVTDENGIAAFGKVPVGKDYTLTQLNVPDYVVTTGTPQTFEMKVNTTKNLYVSNKMKRGGVVVSLFDEKGKNLKMQGVDMVVSGYTAGAGQEVAVAGTDKLGVAQFYELAVSGKDGYTLSVNGIAGYKAVADQNFEVKADEVTKLRVTLVKARGTVTINEIVKKTNSVDGGGVAGVQYTLKGTSLLGEKVNLKAKTDANGNITFKDVLIGSNYIVAADNGEAYDVESIKVKYGSGKAVSKAKEDPIKNLKVDVREDTTTAINVVDNYAVVADAVKVSVVGLTADQAKKLEGKAISLSGKSASGEDVNYTQAYLTDKGGAIFKNVKITGKNYKASLVTDIPGVIVEPIVFNPSDVTDVQLPARTSTGHIAGSVFYEDDSRIADNIDVTLTDAKGNKVTAKTDKDGKFVTGELVSGTTYKLTVKVKVNENTYVTKEPIEVTVPAFNSTLDATTGTKVGTITVPTANTTFDNGKTVKDVVVDTVNVGKIILVAEQTVK